MNIEGYQAVADHGTIVIFTGYEVETGDLIRFGVDRRIAVSLLELADLEDGPEVSVESWQVLSRTEPEDLQDVATTERL